MSKVRCVFIGGRHARPSIGLPGDRGCVSCGKIPEDKHVRDTIVDLIVDERDRYWCIECATAALANVRRRVDERMSLNVQYPWRFVDEAANK